MPRESKGARLWLRPEKRNKDESIRIRAVWVIRDGSSFTSTGCAPKDRALAEIKLGEHIATKYKPSRDKGRHPAEIPIADVLKIYLDDVVDKHVREKDTKIRILELDAWWGDKTLADVNGVNCRAYVKHRVGQPWKSSRSEKTGNKPRLVTAEAPRRELTDLTSAINHHRKEGFCSQVVSVVLPARGEPRDRWLTRSEAARLLWAAWRFRQVTPNGAAPRATRKHLARFILVGLYTGTRSAAIAGAALMPTVGMGYIDFDKGVFYRKAIGRRATSKRQPPVRLPARLLAHMRRWKRKGIVQKTMIEYFGKPIKNVRNGFSAAVRDAGLGPDVIPHVLRHTCATWLMQGGADLWEAAGFLGMTVQQLEKGYGHHHPDYQKGAANALGSR
jgi:hypothetical protein